MTLRRALNLAYVYRVRGMKDEERDDFHRELRMSLVEWRAEQERLRIEEQERRKVLATQYGEMA